MSEISYKAPRKPPLIRRVYELPAELVQQVHEHGVQNGHQSEVSAVRELLTKGLAQTPIRHSEPAETDRSAADERSSETEALVQFKLKLPLSIHDRLRKRAGKNRRPLSAEIVAILESAFEPVAPPQTGIVRPFDAIQAGLLEILSIVQSEKDKRHHE